MNEHNICAICGQEHDDLVEVDGTMYCPDCVDEECFLCEECGEYHRRDDAREVRRIIRYSWVHEYWCEDCADRYATECSHCGELWWTEDIHDDDHGTCLCPRCIDEYETCADCGCFVHRDDVVWDDDDDCAYCRSCWNDNHRSAINSYGYKPEPIFASRRNEANGHLQFGVELEVDCGEDAAATARLVTEQAGGRIYCKRDGSLNRGFEIVTHPATLGYHLYDFRWANIMRICKQGGFKSHDTETCGLHIHVGRRELGATPEERYATAGKLVLLAYALRDELTKFSRRKANRLDDWAAFRVPNVVPGMTEAALVEAGQYASHGNRYSAVNLCNLHTVEFRIFRGTLKRDTLCAALQLVSNLCKYAMSHTAQECLDATFVDVVNVDPTSVLLNYCQSRRLALRTAA